MSIELALTVTTEARPLRYAVHRRTDTSQQWPYGLALVYNSPPARARNNTNDTLLQQVSWSGIVPYHGTTEQNGARSTYPGT